MTWYHNNWRYRKKITIQNANVDSNLTDFPLYVYINADSDIGDEARADGYDIRFALLDGTELPYERETWTGGGGSAVTADIWVETDPTAASSTDIYIYYGNTDAVDGEDKNNVWDANFQAVWHLNNTLTDSTGNGYTLTASGGGVTSVTGKIANGYEFDDASSEYAYKNSAPAATPSTYETLAYKHDTASSGVMVCVVDKDVDTEYQHVALVDVGSGQNCWAGVSSGVEKDATTSNTYSINTWHYCVGTFTNSTLREAYLDADIANKGTNVDAQTPVNQDRVAIGGLITATPVAYFDGVLDEIRISDSVRSEAYIKFVWANINEGDNELTWASEEFYPRRASIMGGVF
jgi:MSHA biogenesis protein MshQ